MKKKKITTATSTHIPDFSHKNVYRIHAAVLSCSFDHAAFAILTSGLVFSRPVALTSGQHSLLFKPPD